MHITKATHYTGLLTFALMAMVCGSVHAAEKAVDTKATSAKTAEAKPAAAPTTDKPASPAAAPVAVAENVVAAPPAPVAEAPKAPAKKVRPRRAHAPKVAKAAEAPAPEAKKDIWERDTLTGDWNGHRTQLEDKGITLSATEISEILGNVTGGVYQSAVYEGRTEFVLDADFDKLMGLKGLTGHANAYQIHGRGLSQNNLNANIITVSNIEAQRTTRLFDLWIQQNFFEDELSIRVGQLAADDEFVTSQYAGLFINSAFGWPSMLATNFPGGGPAFPLSTPGIRIRVGQPEPVSLQVGIFNGDPSGPTGTNTGTSQDRNPSGLNFSLANTPLFMSEITYVRNGEKDATGLPGTYKLGFWYQGGKYNDQRMDDTGLSLADPLTSGNAQLHDTNYGIYGVADQMLWRKEGTEDQGAGAFVRAYATPSDRNLIDYSFDAGINYKGIGNRENDVLGVSFAYENISARARGLDEDTRAFTAVDSPLRGSESIIEATYQAPITPWWTVQPDVQYLIHPGGLVANPNDPSGTVPVKDALILGIRTAIKF